MGEEKTAKKRPPEYSVEYKSAPVWGKYPNTERSTWKD